jgi:hypothetical protein
MSKSTFSSLFLVASLVSAGALTGCSNDTAQPDQGSTSDLALSANLDFSMPDGAIHENDLSMQQGVDGGQDLAVPPDLATPPDLSPPPDLATPPDLSPPPPDRLTVSGTQILGPDHQVIKLRGWNWGQWEATQPGDGAQNATEGATVIRMPLRWWGQWSDKPTDPPASKIDSRDDNNPTEGYIEHNHVIELDNDINNATNAGLWVILFVDSNCGQASIQNDTVAFCGLAPDGVSPSNFGNDPAQATKFHAVWSYLANKYKDHPHIAMYEALPEPQFGCDSTGCSNKGGAVPVYQGIISAIRAQDTRTPIMVGSTGGYDVDLLVDAAVIPNTPNLVYTGNFLNGGSGHPEKVALLTQFGNAHNVPMFVQQVGSRKDQGDPAGVYTIRDTRATTILSTMNQAGIGWTWWTYRESHSDSGTGFAPYYSAGVTNFILDVDWLNTITKCFDVCTP